MVLTEYNEEKTMKAFAKEYLADGEKIGKKRGIIKTAKNMLDKGIDIETTCDVTGLSMNEIEDIKE